MQRRNRRGGVEDRWKLRDGTPSAKAGTGKRWRARYVDHNARERERVFDRKVDAESWLDEQTTGLVTGQYVEPKAGHVTLGELGPSWLGRQTHLKPSAFRPLEIAWRLHVEPTWGRARIVDVMHTTVQQWVSDLAAGPVGDDGERKARSATTVQRAYGVLAAVLDDAVKDRRLITNPARGVKLPRKVRREHTYLTHRQVHDLAAAAGDRGPMVLLLAYGGLRWGEAAGLRVRDLDLLRRRISISQNAVEVGSRVELGTPKNHRRRTVPVPAFLAPVLAEQCVGKGREDLVFPGRAGFMRPPRGTGGWFEGARIRAGLPRLTPHDLRHTAASLAVSAGANVKAVQKMLGHASAAMTLDVYADLFDDDLEAVADRLDLAVTAAGILSRTGTQR
ncbi:site-specific integrase [Nakamurella sp. A5-74]|uniref:Site-specific integrase n=1 Tax=Nakamurella sp. A5-74 TaxID=3158264 RepID=A0AAU8DTE5_9ACTN